MEGNVLQVAVVERQVRESLSSPLFFSLLDPPFHSWTWLVWPECRYWGESGHEQKNFQAAEILEREKRGKTISQRMMIQVSNSFAASVVDHFQSIFLSLNRFFVREIAVIDLKNLSPPPFCRGKAFIISRHSCSFFCSSSAAGEEELGEPVCQGASL